jgi:hypothetical protein
LAWAPRRVELEDPLSRLDELHGGQFDPVHVAQLTQDFAVG